jgi:hypothetical protein
MQFKMEINTCPFFVGVLGCHVPINVESLKWNVRLIKHMSASEYPQLHTGLCHAVLHTCMRSSK